MGRSDVTKEQSCMETEVINYRAQHTKLFLNDVCCNVHAFRRQQVYKVFVLFLNTGHINHNSTCNMQEMAKQ